MSPAKIHTTYIQIDIIYKEKPLKYYFETSIEKIVFEGFMKVYNIKNLEKDNEDNETKASKIPKKDDILDMDEIIATEEFTKAVARYTEASLVKELESKGIGRPSTFANIIGKIQDKKYIERKNIIGEKKKIKIYTLKNSEITLKTKQISLGNEKNKLFPTEIGFQVTKYLESNFENIMDYKFTANMESYLDDIANGKLNWIELLKQFYEPFNKKFLELNGKNNIKISNDKYLGDHTNGSKLYTTTTKFGQAIKMEIGNKKFKYASVIKPLDINSITLNQAIKLFEYPKQLGRCNDGIVELCKGRYGLYLKYNGKNYQVKKEDVTFEEAVKIILDKNKDNIKEVKIKNVLYEIKNGKYGPYISYMKGKKRTFKSIPKSIDPERISDDEIIKLINQPKKKYNY